MVAPQARDLIRAIARKIKDGNIDLPEVPMILKDLNALLDNLDADVKDVQRLLSVIRPSPPVWLRLKFADLWRSALGGQSHRLLYLDTSRQYRDSKSCHD